MLTRSALGLVNADDPVPTESTYYLFRKKVNDYAKAGNGNLFKLCFADMTKSQCTEFNVSGKRIRMDSKLLGSNIAMSYIISHCETIEKKGLSERTHGLMTQLLNCCLAKMSSIPSALWF